MVYTYPQPHRFTRQKEPKNVQNGPELKEIGLISMSFTKSVIYPSVLVQKIRFWACSKAHGYRYRNPYPYPEPGPDYPNPCHSLLLRGALEHLIVLVHCKVWCRLDKIEGVSGWESTQKVQ